MPTEAWVYIGITAVCIVFWYVFVSSLTDTPLAAWRRPVATEYKAGVRVRKTARVDKGGGLEHDEAKDP